MTPNSHKTFDELSNSIGAVPALKLCSFFHGTSLYVPQKWVHGHIIEKLIGREAFDYLIRGHGNETINIPELEMLDLRRAGRLHQLLKLGCSDTLAAQLIGVSKRQIHNIKTQLLSFNESLFSEEA
jgi:hypothetical protein